MLVRHQASSPVRSTPLPTCTYHHSHQRLHTATTARGPSWCTAGTGSFFADPLVGRPVVATCYPRPSSPACCAVLSCRVLLTSYSCNLPPKSPLHTLISSNGRAKQQHQRHLRPSSIAPFESRLVGLPLQGQCADLSPRTEDIAPPNSSSLPLQEERHVLQPYSLARWPPPDQSGASLRQQLRSLLLATTQRLRLASCEYRSRHSYFLTNIPQSTYHHQREHKQ